MSIYLIITRMYQTLDELEYILTKPKRLSKFSKFFNELKILGLIFTVLFFVLLTGNLINGKTGEILASRTQLFGDGLIKSNHYSEYDIICQGECRTVEFEWDDIVLKLI